MPTTPSQAVLLGLCFNHAPPTAEVLSRVVATLDGVSAAWLAIRDDNSLKAAQWTQDAQQLLPTGRLSLHFNNEVARQRARELLRDALPLMVFYPCHCTTVSSPDIHVNEPFVGTLQLCCFRQRDDISRETFTERWLGEHTAVALETQSTVGYRQNLIDQGSDMDAENLPTKPFYDAIVEEYFPMAAATSAAHFFNAADDTAQLKINIARMQQSCARFIDFSTILVIHLSDRRIF